MPLRSAFVSIAVAFGLALGACAGGSTGPAGAPEVDVDSGRVAGVRDGDVLRFGGVPYAAAPVGPRRFAVPASAPAWSETRDARRLSRPCPPASAQAAEACLTVDVTTPAAARPGERRPVMVWLHGGGFSSGAGVDYDPARLSARGDVVVVTVEFRLGALAAMAPAGVDDPGALLLRDQQAALRWVRRNAAAFGGDPANVTLFGQSGGAIGACAQLTAPAARGLFERVILQSGSCSTVALAEVTGPGSGTVPYFTPLAAARGATEEAARSLGCDRGADGARLRCLRALPAADLARQAQFASLAYGATTLPREPAQALRDGAAPAIDVLSGHTREEARYFALLRELAAGPVAPADLEPLVRRTFGPLAPAVRREYGMPSGREPAQDWARPVGDAMFACPQLATNDALAASGSRVHAYEFADASAPAFAVPGQRAGAAHASELAYLFDLRSSPVRLDARQRQVSDAMIDAWARFARTGAPGAPGAWPRWDGTRRARVLGGDLAEGATTRVAATHHCDFWAQAGPVPVRPPAAAG